MFSQFLKASEWWTGQEPSCLRTVSGQKERLVNYLRIQRVLFVPVLLGVRVAQQVLWSREVQRVRLVLLHQPDQKVQLDLVLPSGRADRRVLGVRLGLPLQADQWVLAGPAKSMRRTVVLSVLPQNGTDLYHSVHNSCEVWFFNQNLVERENSIFGRKAAS